MELEIQFLGKNGQGYIVKGIAMRDGERQLEGSNFRLHTMAPNTFEDKFIVDYATGLPTDLHYTSFFWEAYLWHPAINHINEKDVSVGEKWTFRTLDGYLASAEIVGIREVAKQRCYMTEVTIAEKNIGQPDKLCIAKELPLILKYEGSALGKDVNLILVRYAERL